MINVSISQKPTEQMVPKIFVIGVGGGGNNAVNGMQKSNQEGCNFIVTNTDQQALQNSSVETKVQLGPHITGGLGAGSKPEVGAAAADESLEEVMQYMDGANMVFVTAGMGGGTGTGAAPVIAKACRERGILTVGVVTKPFHFEGAHRMRIAEKGIEEMQKYVDTLIVIPNQNLFRIANEKTTFADAFHMADSVLRSGVQGVTDLMVKPGLVNLDFADIRTAMMEMGKAMMGTGEAGGEKRAIEAAESAINNPLLDDVSMKGARGVIINVTGGNDMTLFEADEACNRIRDEVDPDANIIFGATFDENMDGKMRVSIVATGIDKIAVSGTGTIHEPTVAKPHTSVGFGGGGTTTPETKPLTGISTQPQVQTPATTASNAVVMAETSTQSSAPVYATTTAMAAKPLAKPTAPKPLPERQENKQTARIAAQEIDMFDQGEFAQGTNNPEEAQIPQNTSMRGAVYNNAFIPPKPVVPDTPETTEVPAGNSFHATQGAQQGPQSYIPYPSTGGLKLNPPKPPTEKPKKQKSLLDRLTNTVQQKIESLREEQTESQETKTRVAPTPTVENKNPAQPSLNIDSPAGTAKDRNDLDIPAFLRRQAN